MQALLNFIRAGYKQVHNESLPNSSANVSSPACEVALPLPSPQPIESLTLKERETLGALVEKLPNEVLSQIFFWCTPTSADQDDLSPCAAIHLSHVCKHWRRITLESPRLWTYTRIPIVNQRLEHSVALAKLYLERSKMRPIFLDFDFVEDYSYYQPVLPLFERIIDVAKSMRPAWLVQNSFLATHLEASSSEHRATREEWYFWSAQPEVSALSPVPPSDGNADRSRTESRFLGEAGDYLQLANTSAHKPLTLEETSVTIRALRFAIGSFVLEPYRSWAPSLTFLVIKDLNNYTNLTTASASQILSSFPLLVHCSLHIDFEVAEQFPAGFEPDAAANEGERLRALAPQGIELPFLKSLSLSWSDFTNIGNLIDSLNVPSLTELEMDGITPDADGDGAGDGWNHLVRLLRRNAPPLTHLILTKLDLFHVNFLEALALAPNLEGIWLEDVLLDDSIVQGIISGSGALGSLTTLVILDSYAVDIAVLARELKTADGLRTRRGGAEKIKVYVDKCGEATEEHLRLIESLDIELEIGPESLKGMTTFHSESPPTAGEEGSAWIDEVE